VTRVSQDSNDSHHKSNAVSGEWQSKFTPSEKPNIWRWLCDADIKKNLYKSCTMIKVFWGHNNIVLWKELHSNKSSASVIIISMKKVLLYIWLNIVLLYIYGSTHLVWFHPSFHLLHPLSSTTNSSILIKTSQESLRCVFPDQKKGFYSLFPASPLVSNATQMNQTEDWVRVSPQWKLAHTHTHTHIMQRLHWAWYRTFLRPVADIKGFKTVVMFLFLPD